MKLRWLEKGGSLTFRPLPRAFQPHEMRFNSFGGLGHSPSSKQAFREDLWWLCDAKLMRSGNEMRLRRRRQVGRGRSPSPEGAARARAFFTTIGVSKKFYMFAPPQWRLRYSESRSAWESLMFLDRIYMIFRVGVPSRSWGAVSSRQRLPLLVCPFLPTEWRLATSARRRRIGRWPMPCLRRSRRMDVESRQIV